MTTATIKKPVIGITIGDINGIGPEIILKSLSDNRVLNYFTPVVYSSEQVISYMRKVMDLRGFQYQLIRDAIHAQTNKNYILSPWDDELRVELGKPTLASGKAAIFSLQRAVEDLKAGKLDAIVTAPVNKKNMQEAGFKFPGHTEFFADTFSAKPLMFMVTDELKVGMVTGHIPLSEVSSAISVENILEKLRLMHNSLVVDFGLNRPRIGVLGLNPHAGEGGLLGNEENLAILPAIEAAMEENILTFGPYPADGFFGMAMSREFDAVLAMYHDQGLIPFKNLHFDRGVNFTAGLPIVRTSPDHGTAFSIAGKNQANASSFSESLHMACKIITNRQQYKELNNNPLVSSREKEKES